MLDCKQVLNHFFFNCKQYIFYDVQGQYCKVPTEPVS